MVFLAGIITGFIAAVFVYAGYLKSQDMLGNQRRKAMYVSQSSVKRVTAVKLEDKDFYEPFVSIDPIIRTNSSTDKEYIPS